MNFDCKNTIIRHRIFKKCYNEIAKEETNRIFCRHDMGHFLDVARLMMILNVKENLMGKYHHYTIFQCPKTYIQTQ